MEEIKCSRTEVIKEFLVSITETEEYKSVEYLVFSIRKQMLDYLRTFRCSNNKFKIPSFLQPLVGRVGEIYQNMQITVNDILDYMKKNDSHGWIMYYDTAFIHRPGVTETVQVDAEFLFMIIAGFVLDTFKSQRININDILDGERIIYETNQYGLTIVNRCAGKE